MLKIDTLPMGSYQTNCYIIRDDRSAKCALIDPGCDPDYILEKVRSLGLTVEAILLTHGHFDHVLAVSEIANITGCPVWMHVGDHHPELAQMAAFFYPLSKMELSSVHYCDGGDTITVAGLNIAVMATPGHTPGSVCYQCENALFTGDTLFAGSVGRTDLPGGSYRTIQDSLVQLANLAENYAIYPGHGEASQLDIEKRSNPYL